MEILVQGFWDWWALAAALLCLFAAGGNFADGRYLWVATLLLLAVLNLVSLVLT